MAKNSFWDSLFRIDALISIYGYIKAAITALGGSMGGIAASLANVSWPIWVLAIMGGATIGLSFANALAKRRFVGIPSEAVGNVALVEPKQFNPLWLNVETISLWHAACLWVDEEPALPIRHTTKPYPALKMLEADMDNKILPARPMADSEQAWARITRAELIEYVNKRGISPRPKFLFPNG